MEQNKEGTFLPVKNSDLLSNSSSSFPEKKKSIASNKNGMKINGNNDAVSD